MRNFLLLACFAVSLLGCSDPAETTASPTGPHAEDAFAEWLGSGDGTGAGNRASDFAAFRTFLKENGVEDVVPAWQLLRTDANYAARCDLEAFAMPPRSKWPAIVPTLRLIREEVIPVVGPVEVNSAWRSDELNECVNGASRSRHLAFSALDLIASERDDRTELFRDLCSMHARVGARTKMGLGAYYNSWQPLRNRIGRFHIDASGYRTWGYDYTHKSSGCLFL